MIKWIVTDEVDNSSHKKRKDAMAEFDRLLYKKPDYPYKDTLEVLRVDEEKDEYKVVISYLIVNDYHKIGSLIDGEYHNLEHMNKTELKIYLLDSGFSKESVNYFLKNGNY